MKVTAKEFMGLSLDQGRFKRPGIAAILNWYYAELYFHSNKNPGS